MTSPLLLRAFVNERLTAAAEEIFHVFERTMVKYEEEASSCKQEIERLRGLLLESQQRTDVSRSPVWKEEIPSEQQHCEVELSLSVQQEDAKPRHIKEESPEHWAAEQQAAEEEEEQMKQFRTVNVLYAAHSPICEQDDTNQSLPNCENEDEFEESENSQVFLPLHSTPSPQTVGQSQSSEDRRESDRPAEQVQPSFQTSTELPHANLCNYQCFLCNKCFSSSPNLINHAIRLHSSDSSLLCAVCGKTLESTESLNFHLQTHKGSRCCHVCGRHCKSTTALTEHMASHAGVKLHRCPVCGNEFNRKSDLKVHMRIHTGEKPFCCSYCCKSFSTSGHMKRHMRSHTGERPHRCEVCGRGFLQGAHLKYHLTTHALK
ncbi:zinc finger and BTB domain-containing protein 49-like [Salarias fasciatus]|uniref:Zinc finger and BTB domain-containing protein 49-like n=1 Tax=Salarias fasciatus TaxID=181472 RepID=A0A672JM84_SALFA|nr:zinc finger and BTB domain-containing protein 49-like [Salarias fasciatus]